MVGSPNSRAIATVPGSRVDLRRAVDLLEAAVQQDRDAVAERHRLA